MTIDFTALADHEPATPLIEICLPICWNKIWSAASRADDIEHARRPGARP